MHGVWTHGSEAGWQGIPRRARAVRGEFNQIQANQTDQTNFDGILMPGAIGGPRERPRRLRADRGQSKRIKVDQTNFGGIWMQGAKLEMQESLRTVRAARGKLSSSSMQ